MKNSYLVEGEYFKAIAFLRISPNSIEGYPKDLVRKVRGAMLSGASVIPHPQPQPSYQMDPNDSDHILAYLRNVHGLRITTITPPLATAPIDLPLPTGAVN